MVDTIVKLLKASGVTAWELTDEIVRGWEFYFIRHALDQNRAKDVEHITVQVYQLSEDGQSLGRASAQIAPTATEAEAKALIESLAYRATLVKNKPYTLRAPSPVKLPAQQSIDVAGIAAQFLDTMRALPETATEDINSYELFVSEKTRRFLSSTGVDVRETFPSSMIEVVVNARGGEREIELYRNYRSGGCDAEGLRRDLARTMQYGRDRLRAKPTPALGKADVLFSSSAACELYRYFVDRTDASMIYRKMSDWQLGVPIAEDIRGDKVTVRAVPALPNSSGNRLFDEQGAPVYETVLVRDSVPEHFLGGRMFSCYLGLEDSFIPTNISVDPGEHSEEELRQGAYLEVVDFSDFQVDAMTGDVFGEIRLAYWHDGKTVTPVSGGSLSGSMGEYVKEMTLSAETAQYDAIRIPALTRVSGMTVTGIEEL